VTTARAALLRTLILATGCTTALGAQSIPASAGEHDGVRHTSWLSRLSISARAGVLAPRGQSELFALLDDALSPGGDALRPRLVGGDVQYRLTPRWSVMIGGERGSRTIGSSSLMAPAGTTTGVAQRTSLELSGAQYLGAELEAIGLGGVASSGQHRVQLLLSGGVGAAQYRLRQWGEFVDVPRAYAYAEDFRSAGSGAFSFLGAGLRIPLSARLALQANARRQFGSAPMSADYSTFDRLDLGGTQVSVGFRLRPGGR